MNDILKTLVATPASVILLLAALAFLFIAVVGSVAGRIDPGKAGRLVSGIIGALLLILSFSVGSNQIPAGSYQGTCQNMYVQGNILYASCVRIDGQYTPPSLENFKNCKGISNEDGSLRCQN